MHKRVIYALAGLETATTGVLAMLAFLAAGSLWTRHSVWWIPNLVASSVYGQRSVRDAIGLHTAAGLALTLIAYGLAGVLFGEIVGDRPGGGRFFWLSLAAGLLAYWASLNWFWRALNPVGHLYAPDGQILIAHLLFGCFLSLYPSAQRRLANLPD